LRTLLEVHMYFNEYNSVKSSTVSAGYDVGVTNMIKSRAVVMKALMGQSNQWDLCIQSRVQYNLIKSV